MKIEPRPSYHRDLKKRGLSISERDILADFLYDTRQGADLVKRYGEHELMEDWAGYLECHLASDWLVIYKRFNDRIVLYRTGTHADLFGQYRRR